MTPEELLGEARAFLVRTEGLLPAMWPRAAAVLGRQSLEAWVGVTWRADPGAWDMADCSMRSQLLGLGMLVGEDVAARADFVWAALSEACHYHPYELAPTAPELEGWLDEVERLVTA